jgi:two-component system response regulator RegA
MQTDRVLIVDDEVEYVDALAERLRARGLVVETAFSGEEALEKVKAAEFHAIVLDFAMPGMNGIETLRALRKNSPLVQVMLLTGQATIQAAVEATRLGAVDVLEKPTDIDTLLEKIRMARARYIAAKDEGSESQVDDIMRRRGW